jgi:hypothetical protein
VTCTVTTLMLREFQDKHTDQCQQVSMKTIAHNSSSHHLKQSITDALPELLHHLLATLVFISKPYRLGEANIISNSM